jgi:hypothetical protein
MVPRPLRTALRPRWGDVATPLRRFPPTPGMAATTVHSTSTRRSGAIQPCNSASAGTLPPRSDGAAASPLPPSHSVGPRLRRLAGPQARFATPPAPPSAPLAPLAPTRAPPCGAPFEWPAAVGNKADNRLTETRLQLPAERAHRGIPEQPAAHRRELRHGLHGLPSHVGLLATSHAHEREPVEPIQLAGINTPSKAAASPWTRTRVRRAGVLEQGSIEGREWAST